MFCSNVTYEVNHEAPIRKTTGRRVKICFPVGRRGLAKGSRETTGVGVGVSKVEYGRKAALG